MALITAPDLPVSAMQWSLDRPAQINTGIEGKRRASTSPLYGKWRARVDLATQASEDDFRALRSFLVRCCGPVHTFHLPATVEAQNSDSVVTVASTAAAGATTMSLAGYSSSLNAGDMVTVNGQLLVLLASQAGASITFEPPLRAQAAAGTAVETANPYALVHLSSPEAGWSVEPWRRFRAAFDVEEAI